MSKHDLIIKPQVRDSATLKRLQALPLEQKVNISERRIMQYAEMTNSVYVSFSGGEDSTVLLDIVRKLLPDTPAVFCDTGLEWPEIRDFVKTFDNVEWLKPEMSFKKVIEKYGYPIPSKQICKKIREVKTTKSEKHYNNLMHGPAVKKISEKWKFLIDAPFSVSDRCCDIMKKNPAKKYEKKTGRSAIVGTMAEESMQRGRGWIHHGCNSYGVRNMPAPLSFWTKGDVLEYIKTRKLKYSEIYDKGYDRTGCVFCMYGHFQMMKAGKENNFLKMKRTHSKLYSYCMENLGLDKVLSYCEKNLNICSAFEEFH